MGRLIETVPRHGVKTSYAYDAAGRVTKVTEGERVTRYAYDLAGNVTKATLPDGSETAYRYDANNNPIRVIDALGSETSYRYDTMGRLLSVRQPNGATLRLRYDLAGNLTQETDAMGGKQVYAYDALGRLVSVTDALGNKTAYGYDVLDNLISVLDANGHETRYAYDPLSRLRTETDARGNTTAYDYTPEGWLKQTKRPDGTTLSYTYDKTGYLLKETASDGTEIRHAFDALGELTEIADETGTTKLRYDERGLLIGVENPLGDVVQYTYNAYGEKIGITYPDGKQATYTYDALSRLLSVTEPNGNTTTYTYDALGRRTSTSDGSTTTEYRYDKVGNLTKQTNDAVTLTYKYDLNGRMIGETREEGKTVTRTNYAYDKAGQLTSFRRSDGNAERYKYDPAGNMIEKVQNGTKIAMTYTAANELQSMESPHGKLTYAYDQNGNLTQKTYNNRTDTYSYDTRNHLRQYRGYDNYTVKYSYNALGMLHAKEATGSNTRTTLEELIAGKEDSDDPDGDAEPRTTTYVYDLTQPYYEVLTESTDGKVTSYTYGLERLAAYTDNTKTAYLYDGRGSVIQANGESKFYSPFGELLSEKVSGYGFNGEYFDAATGMLNLRARQYEPGQARFSQRDIEKGEVTNVTSLNRYAFTWNDPVNFFDASGASPNLVRNVVMADSGSGSAATVKLANKTQFRVGVGQHANRVTNRERILLDNPEEAAQLSYSKKQHALLKVGHAAVLKGYVCTAAVGMSTEIPEIPNGGDPVIKLANGKEYHLFDDWFYRWETNRFEDSEKNHMHVYNKKKGIDYSQDEDGRPHHKNKTPKGPLPRKVQKQLKEKTGWDYEEKRKNFFKMVDENMVRDESTVAYAFTYPDGKTVYRKNKPFFNGANAMERIYYEGSNIDIGDSIIVTPDQIPFIFMPNIYGPMPSFNLGFGSDFILNPAF